jgi:arylsulfatase
MDFMKTFMDVSNAAYPKTYKGNTISPTTGNSLLPAIEGNRVYGHQVLFNEHYNAGYVRDNGWKLVSRSGDKIWHLYKIDEDETELNDLADKYPEKVKELSEKWQKWANENKVLPKR